MSRQPTRLSDFQIPRGEEPATPLLKSAGREIVQDRAAHEESASEPAHIPKIAPRPVQEPRQAMTVRLPVSFHERIRTLMFTSRRSQQDIVEEALGAYLKANGL